MKNTLRTTIHAIWILPSLLTGGIVSWFIKDEFTLLITAGKSFDGRSLPVQIAILAALVAVTTLLAYFLLSSLDMRYGWQEKIKQAQWHITTWQKMRWIRLFSRLFFVLAVMVVFVPWLPAMPAYGLDPSWILSMNQAVAQRLSFGNEIIFTYGPYASILTMAYHPATDQMILFGSLFLAVVYIGMLLTLASNVNSLWVMFFALFLPFISRDVLFFSHSFILLLLVYRITLPENHSYKLNFSRFSFVEILVYFFSLGLLPAMKGTLPVAVGMTMFLSAFLFWINKQKKEAFVVVISPVLSFLLFWLIAGQTWRVLPDFFISLGQIISGYTEAMAITGHHDSDIFLFIGVATVVLSALVIQKPMITFSKLFLLLIYAFFLFWSFKNAFVRHDGHAIQSGNAIMLSALLLPFVTKNKLIFPSFLLAVFAWSIITSHYVNLNSVYLYNQTIGRYVSAWQGLRSRVTERDFLSEKYERSLAEIHAEIEIPELSGTTDIYPWDQAYLIASNNIWNPRPVIQSYSAYTPLLAKINEDHLLAEDAPDNILFSVQTIDGRFPALEDGLSWPTLINKYSVKGFIHPYIYFQKRNLHTGNEVFISQNQPTVVFDGEGIFNTWFELPETQEPLLAQITIEPTLVGKLFSLIYKTPEIRIKLVLENGENRDYRLIPSMAKTPFFISPLVETTDDFLLLATNSINLTSMSRVKNIQISASNYSSKIAQKWFEWSWQPTYHITLSAVPLHQDDTLSTLDFFSQTENADSLNPVSLQPVSCEGFIDTINKQRIEPGSFVSITRLLSIVGWTAVSTTDGTAPEKVYIVLTDKTGQTIYIPAKKDNRLDVAAHFNKPSLSNTGYRAIFDVRNLDGIYTLRIARINQGVLEHCNNFANTIEIKSIPLP